MYIDTHCHLLDEKINDIENILIKARELNVQKFITCATDLNSSIDAVKFADSHDGVYASIGLYPEYAQQYNDQFESEIAKLAQNKKVVAIGEIGLDYSLLNCDREKQKEVFARQLNLANDLKKPIVIHCREAYGDLITLLKSHRNLLKWGGTCHCFTASKEIASEILKLDLHISANGVSTFKNAENVRNMLKTIPLSRILLETDSPYLAPHPYRSQINTPCFIPIIAHSLAEILGVSPEEIEVATTTNARRLFNI